MEDAGSFQKRVLPHEGTSRECCRGRAIDREAGDFQQGAPWDRGTGWGASNRGYRLAEGQHGAPQDWGAGMGELLARGHLMWGLGGYSKG